MKMKAAIISLGSQSSIMLAEAMKKYFDQVDMIDLRKIEVDLSKKYEIIYEGNPLPHYDCIYAKGSFRYEPVLMAITSFYEVTSYMPLKANTFSVAHDKIYTQVALQNSKIPMPTTYLSATVSSAKNILKRINYPIVMKFPKGTQGKGVLFGDSYSSASSILDALESLRQPFLIQEYLETNGMDVRLFVVGDKVIAAMKRKAERGENRANIHAGGTGESFQPDEKMVKLAVEAAKAIGADICGVDLLESPRGPVVIEVNVSPGMQGITAATGIDIPDIVAKFIFEKSAQKLGLKKEDLAKDVIRSIEVPKIKDIITNLDFRGNRILLPELATKITQFDDKVEVLMNLEKNSITLKKYDKSAINQ